MQTGSSDHNPGQDGTAPDRAARIGQMRVALDSALAIAPGFINGDVDADTMTNAMVRLATPHAGTALGADVSEADEEHELHAAMTELLTCGSGYLSGRCDADCVVRTMTQMLSEFTASGS